MGDNFRIYFVKPEKNGENNKTLYEAFEALNRTEYNLKPEWITTQKCLEADGKGKQTYIFDPFGGVAFEHIKNCGYRIYGPRCILANLHHGMDLPRRKRQPIFNLAMKDMKICCTSVEGVEREGITEKVQLMGGTVERNLTGDVTHLIAGEVGSNKYMVAVDNEKAVMIKDWVHKVWEQSQDKHILATDETFQKYACPPLLGVTIVVSGFKTKERNQLRSFVLRGGGKYSGELRMNECTHLIVKEPQGAKYEAAKNWHIKIVKDRWLYDCMDKGRYLDPKPYQFVIDPQSKSVLTSTPERKSTVGPSISDISAITHTGLNTSMQQVDETTDLTSARFSEQFSTLERRSGVAETKIGVTCLESDVTVTSADVFLDGCQIYLSGIKPSIQEKLKKIITAGCGLRSMEISDSTTHVVIGEIVASDVMILNSLAEWIPDFSFNPVGTMDTDCLSLIKPSVMQYLDVKQNCNVCGQISHPHVVTVDWLMDCFHQHTHVSEEKYLCLDLGLHMPSKSDRYLTKSLKSSHRKVQVSRDEQKNETLDAGNGKKENIQDSQAFRVDAPSDLEMVELLSQYMETSDSKPDTRMKDDEVQAMVRDRCEDKHDVTIRAVEENEEDQLTQDPNGKCDETGADAGIFHKMKFIILGFEEDEIEQLITLIEAKGGSVLPSSKTRQVADIAVVPLMGFPVDVTVSEILTNAWLQMCVEEEQLLPYDGWLFRPLEPPETDPLIGCCISVSGYVGVERECILHLAQMMGADCQEHFARKPRKGVAASTHLVVNCPSGTKYEAAKKWNIPAVGREWICACLKTGQRVPEDEYLIENLVEKRLQVPANPEAVKSAHSSATSLPTPTKADVGYQQEHGHDDVLNYREAKSNVMDDRAEAEEPAGLQMIPTSDSREKMQNASGKEELSVEMVSKEREEPSEKESKKEQIERMPASSAESCDSDIGTNVNMNPMFEIRHHLSTPVSSKRRNRSSSRNSACRPNQSENITAGCLKTPVDKQRQKWGQFAHGDSPSASTPQGLIRGGGGETPGTFMQPGFKPKFNLDGIFTTPDGTVDLNKSTPLGETFKRQISKAVQNVTSENAAATMGSDVDLAPSQSQTDSVAPLRGVVIAVAKRLGHSHEQYNSIVVDLGGNYSWHNGQHVTHFVFQGRPNDTNKEFRKAREERKIIVSPYWLFACKETNSRIDESLFPHNYNPNFSLTMTPASKATPLRSTRSVSKTKGKLEPSSRSAGLTPVRKMNALDIQQGIRSGAAVTSASTAVAGTSHSSSRAYHKVAKQEHYTNRATLEEDLVQPVNDISINEDCITDNDVSNEDFANKSADHEMKEALSKTLEGILSESTRSKKSSKKRTSSKRSSDQPSTSEGNTSQESLPKTGASVWTETKQDAVVPEQQQSLQVTWEDPAERMEKEKQAFWLEKAPEPTQDTDELLVAMEIPFDELEAQHDNLVSKSKLGTKNVPNERSPTPEPPPLAFPTAKPSSSVPPPQPIELLNEESSDSKICTRLKTVPVFLISGMQNQERLDYAALVEQLGGKMIEKQHFDPSCTHLVVSQPTRNEKYLSCLASGKWILHKSYFEACRAEGRFVKEDSHEWGSSFTMPLIQNMTNQASRLAAAAFTWRKKIESLREADPSCKGAYDGWKVLLCLDKTKEENFQRLLEAGGAEVSVIKSPFPENVQGTHAFVDLGKAKVLAEDLMKLLKADIHCLKPEYIPAYLTDDPPPDPSEFYPTEYLELKERQNHVSISERQDIRKRRRAKDDCTSSNKTPRR